MKFCDTCNNMLYMRVQPAQDGKSPPVLLDVCTACGSSSERSKEDLAEPVYSRNYGDNQVSYKQLMTPHLEHSPTLPHKSDIECINPNCTRRPGQVRDVIYLKSNRDDLKYIYQCQHCKEFFNSG